MKVFRFYFWVNITFSILMLLLDLDARFRALRYRLDDVILTVSFLCAILQIISVLQMVNLMGERSGVRALFILLPASGSFLLAFATMEIFYTDWPFGEVPRMYVLVDLVLVGLGILLYVVGSFLVRSKRLKRGLRIWAIWLIVFTGIIISTSLYANRLYARRAWADYLIIFEVGILFVPLLPLQYRLWKRDPHLERLEAEARAIGEPENERP